MFASMCIIYEVTRLLVMSGLVFVVWCPKTISGLDSSSCLGNDCFEGLTNRTMC